MVESTEGNPQPLNIYQKIAAVTAAIETPLQKDKEVKLRGDSGYSYISHDAVTLAVRKPLSEQGVIVRPTVLECKNDGNRTEMRISVDFINADAPEEKITVESIGYGVDPSDKGPGKAYSYAVKYAYLKLFMLNSDDDIEAVEFTHDPAVPRDSQIQQAREETREAIETAAKNLKAAIDGATTVKELNEIQRENKDWLMGVPEVTRDYFIEQIQTRKTALKGTDDE